MGNFAKDKPTYRVPQPLKKDWDYVGDGKFHDPTPSNPAMHGRRWMIDPSHNDGKSFGKFQEGLKNDR